MAVQGPANANPIPRSVTMRRVANSQYVVTNDRGGELRIGKGEGTDFTPVDLLLAAIGGCTAIDVDLVTSRRAEPDEFTVTVDGEKVRDDGGNRLTDLTVTFHVTFPATPGGDEARAILPDIVRKSHDRLCSVGRTVEQGTPITTKIF
jgi:putative redox protein